jgi:hypothetical protein
LRKKEFLVLKFWSILGLVLTSAAAHCETGAPWFGSEAETAEQVSISFAASQSQKTTQTDNCTIYSCSSLVKIAMPLKNSGANP